MNEISTYLYVSYFFYFVTILKTMNEIFPNSENTLPYLQINIMRVSKIKTRKIRRKEK